MTISSYKVESVLRAYNKQTNSKESISNKTVNSDKYKDVVKLSPENEKKNVYEKISHGLLDVILQNDKPK